MKCTYAGTTPTQVKKSFTKIVFLVAAIITVCGLASAQHWIPAPTFPGSGAAQAVLTPWGDILVQEISGLSGFGTGNWYVLHPDVFGSYTTGTWSGPITTPSGYAPEFFGSAAASDAWLNFSIFHLASPQPCTAATIARCGQVPPARNHATQAGKIVRQLFRQAWNWNVSERDRRLSAGKERR
jgi:hypothetical protein